MKFGIRELLFIGFLAAIPLSAYFWVFKPAKLNLQIQQTALEAKKKKLTDLKNSLVGIENISEEVDKLTEAVEFFEKKLPARHEIHKVLDNVTRIADRQSLETRLFKTLKPKPFANFSEQPIKMEVHGDFDSYYQFLLELEQLPRITKVRKMLLKKDDKIEGAMTANFLLSIFFDSSNIVVAK